MKLDVNLIWIHRLGLRTHLRPSEALANSHPGLDPGTSCIPPRCRFEGVFDWFPDQVRDDY